MTDDKTSRPSDETEGATAPQVKREIERNRGSDVTVHPAASPLGTDAEAGAADTTREELEIARRQEARRPPVTTEDADDED